jgi:HNH endonuclease
MIDMTPLDIAKFWQKTYIDESSKIIRDAKKWYGHCWLWKGPFFSSKYGHYILRQKDYRSHRVAYLIAFGPFDENLLVCHKCDNPSCVNPQHLFLGTPKDNTEDMISKGRLNRSRGEGKGISYRKDNGKWRARYMHDYKNVLVGEFETHDEAVEALKNARSNTLVKLQGKG